MLAVSTAAGDLIGGSVSLALLDIVVTGLFVVSIVSEAFSVAFRVGFSGVAPSGDFDSGLGAFFIGWTGDGISGVDGLFGTDDSGSLDFEFEFLDSGFQDFDLFHVNSFMIHTLAVGALNLGFFH